MSNISNVSIYHITHVDNLQSIIGNGMLMSDASIQHNERTFTNIGHPHIKERRFGKPVPCWKNVTIGQCVPFYFGVRSPMLYAIHKENVNNYSGGQDSIIYLVASVRAVVEACPDRWCFTDGHAAEGLTQFFVNLTQLEALDWESIEARYWVDTDRTPDRKRSKQSEFLVNESFDWHLIEKIGVKNNDMLYRVKNIISESPHRPLVTVESSWYY